MAVDPNDPNRLFVAVLGHPYGPNSERGIYRSLDGGATFQRVLYENENVGRIRRRARPSNDPRPSTQRSGRRDKRRGRSAPPLKFRAAGSSSRPTAARRGRRLRNGLPARIGRAEVAVAPSNSQIVYAYADVEAKGDDAGALYRSDDAGAHFTRVNDADEIAQRGDDLISLAVDPRDPQTVYLTNTSTYRSHDGGRTLDAIKGAPGGDDYHTVWINPRNPRIIALASDQGATISVDGGATWSSWYNQPTAQMYHVNADDRFPYWICGGQQESGSACVRAAAIGARRPNATGIRSARKSMATSFPIRFTHGIFFGGKVEKFDERTGQTQEVSPIAFPSKQYRTVRTEPLAFDPFDQRRLYFGSNVVFATDNGGQSWHAISPDLTRTHPGVPPVLGAFESDDPQHGAHRGVVYAIAPSHVREGTIWAGTDDGSSGSLVLRPAQRQRPLEEHHAAGLDAVEQDRADRRIALRRPDRFRCGQPVPARRSAAVRLHHA